MRAARGRPATCWPSTRSTSTTCGSRTLVAAGRALAAVTRPRRRACFARREALWRGPALADAAERRSRAAGGPGWTSCGWPPPRTGSRRSSPGRSAPCAELEAPGRRAPAAGAVRRRCSCARCTRRAGRPTRWRPSSGAGRALADELGADPSPALAALHLAMLRGEPDRRRRRSRPAAPATNLRAPLTSFVGRDDEVAAVGELVGRPAGHADRARRRGQDPAGDRGGPGPASTRRPTGCGWSSWPRSPTRPRSPQAVLTALGLRDAGAARPGRAPHRPTAGTPLERLVGGAGRPAAAARPRQLRARGRRRAPRSPTGCSADCPRLRILATSREPLGITGEVLLAGRAAALPPPDATRPALRVPAVGCSRPGRGGTARLRRWTTAGRRGRICRALDGMPLAIELAAARLRVADRRADRRPARRPVPAADRRQPHGAAPAPDAARRRRLELGPARPTPSAACCAGWPCSPAAPRSTPRRAVCDPAADARRRRGPARRAGRQVAAASSDGGRLPDAGDHPRVRRWSGWTERGETGAAAARGTRACFLALAEPARAARCAPPSSSRGSRVLSAEHDNLHGALRRAIADGDADLAVRFVAGPRLVLVAARPPGRGRRTGRRRARAGRADRPRRARDGVRCRRGQRLRRDR